MADKIYYNKLIRDLIPDRIKSKGSECETRVLDDTEYERELLKKVEEEGSGLASATNREELISELADVQDVIDEIRRFKEISDEELKAAQAKAHEKKGGFTKRLFLLWSSDDGYKTNEKKGT